MKDDTYKKEINELIQKIRAYSHQLSLVIGEELLDEEAKYDDDALIIQSLTMHVNELMNLD